MNENDPLEELWRIKEEISDRFGSVKAIAAEARRIAKAEPLPPAGSQRKLIDGFPRGQSVGDLDPIMQELWDAKEAIAEEFDLHRLVEHLQKQERPEAIAKPRKPSKQTQKKSAFRGSNSKLTKHRANGKH